MLLIQTRVVVSVDSSNSSISTLSLRRRRNKREVRSGAGMDMEDTTFPPDETRFHASLPLSFTLLILDALRGRRDSEFVCVACFCKYVNKFEERILKFHHCHNLIKEHNPQYQDSVQRFCCPAKYDRFPSLHETRVSLRSSSLNSVHNNRFPSHADVRFPLLARYNPKERNDH